MHNFHTLSLEVAVNTEIVVSILLFYNAVSTCVVCDVALWTIFDKLISSYAKCTKHIIFLIQEIIVMTQIC